MNDVLARAACDFEDDALGRQDFTKDTENEIAIAECCRGILASVVHIPHAFPQLGPQNSLLGKSRGNRRMSAQWGVVKVTAVCRRVARHALSQAMISAERARHSANATVICAG